MWNNRNHLLQEHQDRSSGWNIWAYTTFLVNIFFVQQQELASYSCLKQNKLKVWGPISQEWWWWWWWGAPGWPPHCASDGCGFLSVRWQAVHDQLITWARVNNEHEEKPLHISSASWSELKSPHTNKSNIKNGKTKIETPVELLIFYLDFPLQSPTRELCLAARAQSSAKPCSVASKHFQSSW